MSPFCGATGTLSFGHMLTLPMGFKARVDAPLHVHCSCLHVLIRRVDSDCPGQGLVYQEIDTLRKSIGRVPLSWSYDQENGSLCKFKILSQTENIERYCLSFFLGEFVHLFVLFSSLSKVIWSRFMARFSLLW